MCVSLPSQLTQTTSSDPFLCSSPMKIETRQPWFSESALSFFLSPYTVSSMLKPFTHTHHKHTNSLSLTLSLTLSLSLSSLSRSLYIYLSISLPSLLYFSLSRRLDLPLPFTGHPLVSCLIALNKLKQLRRLEFWDTLYISHFALDCSIYLK